MRLLLIFCLSILICFNSSYADADLLAQKDVRTFIKTMVKTHGFTYKQVAYALKYAVFQPQIIASMDKPYEKRSWDSYRDLFLSANRVQAGLKFWRSNQKTLARAQKIYGVPANIIVAILGVETLYGKHQGNYRVLDALSTLAFNYPSRAKFFTKELEQYLLLCRELGVSADKYRGSYAGAMGAPQFMPSSYRFYAIDFSANGKRDLINDNADAIGSVANYFHKHGWQLNHAVAQAVQMTGDSYKKLKVNYSRPNYSLKRLIAAGMHPVGRLRDHPRTMGLIELNTDSGAEYWLAYPNFYVITRYNTSPQYALVVYLLSQQLYAQWVRGL